MGESEIVRVSALADALRQSWRGRTERDRQTERETERERERETDRQ